MEQSKEIQAGLRNSNENSGFANKSAVAVGKFRIIDSYSNLDNCSYIQRNIKTKARDQPKDIADIIQLSYDKNGISNKSAVAVGTSRLIYRYWKNARTNQATKERRNYLEQTKKLKLNFDALMKALGLLINLLLQ